MATNIQLLKRAVVLFPRADYIEVSAVRHARRAWLRSVALLRASSQSKWILDHHITRQT
tara:strand:- start:430945 stop:431121 length:177 start_codon:yes stop_codon:yes gene_type:complete